MPTSRAGATSTWTAGGAAFGGLSWAAAPSEESTAKRPAASAAKARRRIRIHFLKLSRPFHKLRPGRPRRFQPLLAQPQDALEEQRHRKDRLPRKVVGEEGPRAVDPLARHDLPAGLAGEDLVEGQPRGISLRARAAFRRDLERLGDLSGSVDPLEVAAYLLRVSDRKTSASLHPAATMLTKHVAKHRRK